MLNLAQQITNGLIASNNEEVRKTAIQFMKDNEFRLHTAAKSVTCSEVQQKFDIWAEEHKKDYTEISIAIQAAIMTLSESDFIATV